MWLLPDAQAETDIADAIYRIRLATPNNELDDSLMRQLVGGVPDQELLGILEAARSDPRAMALHQEWQEWAATCSCGWELGSRVGREEFPTHRGHPGISAQCDLHILVTACNDFTLILDDAWDQIADWYRDEPKPKRVDVTAEQVYALRADPLTGHEQRVR